MQAMVIIRQKPKQENVRTFTEKLQFEFNQKQLNWKQQVNTSIITSCDLFIFRRSYWLKN